MTFWCRYGSADPYLDPDPIPDPDLAPDLTPFFSDFKDAKKIFFCHIFFLVTYLHAHIFSLKNLIFLLKICVKILFSKNFFRQVKDPDPDPYL